MNTKHASEIRPAQNISPELQLISRAQRGEGKAFFALYELYKRRVYSLCLRISGEAGNAEGLTREVFLGVFRAISAFGEEAEFAAALDHQSIKLAMSARRERKSRPCLAEPSREGIARGRELSAANGLTRCTGPPQEQLLLRDLGIDTGPCFWN